ncbi:gamma-glutamylcyclotransferase family protein [Neoactinobaculum massilliense]|uniref:gamma-glutamylcyclotransferase family protein n=1 Tax=Neoactinobaculum massilliense TaxID=2364794 RepID=UPI0013DE3CA2|nr:gamma-glutamylcyclotransferase family protein [Neoactinobaculum massilliense]
MTKRREYGLIGILAFLLALPLTLAPAAAHAAVSCTSTDSCLFYLNNSWQGGKADIGFVFGRPTDTPVSGDWNGDGTDTIGVHRSNMYYLREANSGGTPAHTFAYGRTTDAPIIGDWDGNNTDTLAVRRGNIYHFKNSLAGGQADHVTAYGKTGDEVFVGDWDGNGKDTLTVRRGNLFYVKNSLAGGQADRVFAYGKPGDEILVGDWDGNGKDTLTVRRGNAWHIRNDLAGGPAQQVIVYGRAKDHALVGDWDGNGTDTPGVFRGYVTPAAPAYRTPVMVYGTLRTGEQAYYIVSGTYAAKRTARALDLDLWVTKHPFYRAWPWAMPGKGGLTGENLYFSNATYNYQVSRMDRWEGYVPGGKPSSMNYIRELHPTNLGNAYVYVATPWRQAQVRQNGTRVPSGDFARY